MSSKVAIIGAGFVGSTSAYAMLIEKVASQIALIDINKDKAEGEAMDLQHGLQFKSNVDIEFGTSFNLCKDADIVIVTAGKHTKPGQSRLELVKENSDLYKKIIPSISKQNKKCILLIVSNPLDILTYLAQKYSKFNKSKVFGTGTTLDTARFRYFLGKKLGISPDSVHAYILGEHGDSSFPVWSSATIGGKKLDNFKGINQAEKKSIYQKVKNAAYEIVAKKGATYYAIGLSVSKIVKTILRNQNSVLPLSTYLDNYNGVSGVCLSVPCIVNRQGIKEQIDIPLNKLEISQLKKSANSMKNLIRSI
jgi:L-lactate dehydrogenase